MLLIYITTNEKWHKSASNSKILNISSSALTNTETHKGGTSRRMSCAAATERLMACAKKPTKNVCADEFLEMRECSRTAGAFVTSAEGRLSVTEAGKKAFSAAGLDALVRFKCLIKFLNRNVF